MQKVVFVLLPVAALAVAVLIFAMVKRREGDPAPGGPVNVVVNDPKSGAAGEASRLRAEIETLRKAEEAQRKRAERAEAKLAEAAAAPVAPAGEPKKAEAPKGDWKTRRDAELEAKVKAMAWRKHTRGVIDYWKELEKSRAEGRAPQFNPELMSMLNGLQTDMNELSKVLGIVGGNSYDVFENEVVGKAWMDSFLQEIGGGAITEEQLALLQQTRLYAEDPKGIDNTLEKWKLMIERNQAYGSETAAILSPDQHALMSKTVTPTFMLSLYAGYGERRLAGAPAVTDFWIDSFKLEAAQRATVETVAQDFTARMKELSQAYTTQYGPSLPREAEFERRLKALDAQIAAEKQLAESLQLDPEQAKKLLKGSGAVIRLAN